MQSSLDESAICEILSQGHVVALIGTSGAVYPAASLPYYAKQRGAEIIEINPERTAFSTISDYTLLGKAGDVLPQIAEALIGSNIS